jgi:hypothetical protein
MKQRKIIFQLFTLAGFLLATSFKEPTNELHISGKVYSDKKDLNGQLVGLHLLVIADNKLVAQTFTIEGGHYELTFTPTNQKSFDFFIASIGIDTSLLKSFEAFQSNVMTCDFKFPPSYRKHLGQIICPKCRRTDKVYPIIYGWGQISERKIVNGDTIYSNIVDKKYYAGTCVSSNLSPKYFCNRDKVKF